MRDVPSLRTFLFVGAQEFDQLYMDMSGKYLLNFLYGYYVNVFQSLV